MEKLKIISIIDSFLGKCHCSLITIYNNYVFFFGSVFIDEKKLSWSHYNEMAIQFNFEHSFSQFLEFLQKRFNVPNFLICVDEIIKCPGSNELIKHIGTLVSGYGNVNFIITTLDSTPLENLRTSSGRNIDWIYLPLLELSSATSLFFKENEKIPHFMEQLILYCGGHPRTLEYLKEYVEGLKVTLPYSQVAFGLIEVTKKLKSKLIPISLEHLEPGF